MEYESVIIIIIIIFIIFIMIIIIIFIIIIIIINTSRWWLQPGRNVEIKMFLIFGVTVVLYFTM